MFDNYKKCLLIYNPNSGKGRTTNALAAIVGVFSEFDYVVTTVPTRKSKDATNIIIDNGSEYDLVVVSGGDGTLTEGISGICKLPKERRPKLGYIPSGTTNDVARSLGISRQPARAARQICTGTSHTLDVGRMDETFFTYVAAFGTGVNVSYQTPQSMKKALGHSAYAIEMVKSFAETKVIPARITLDTGEIIDEEIIFGMVSSSSSVGGFQGITGNDVSMDDGTFELTIVPALSVRLQEDWDLLNDVIEGREKDRGFFRTYKVSKVAFDFETPIDWTIDGEYAGAHASVEIEVLPHHVELTY